MSLAALIAASALSACGGSSSAGDDTNPSGGTQPAATTAAGGFDKVAATRTAKAALLTLDDLPDGWTAEPSDASDADDEAVNSQLADCLGVDADFFAGSGPDKVEVKSDDFSSPNDGASGGVSQSVNVETTERMTNDFSVINSPKLTGCLETVYGAFLKQEFAEDPQTKGAEVGDVTATRSNIPTYGDESTGIAIKVPFSIGTTDAEVDLDMIFVRVGNVGAQLVFENTFKPFDTETAAGITSKAAAKLSQAAA
jgi:hypothetical protein